MQYIENRISDETNPKAFYKYVISRRKVSTGILSTKRDGVTMAELNTEKAVELRNCVCLRKYQ